ncbi:hypothetical protein HYV49_04330 [Candidatus Pacearchaeota archaeon]|nr:hypothetical protein [Candidatus Pacearchaeota archaeon]
MAKKRKRAKRLLKNSKKLVKMAMRDPLVKEYVAKQKRLAESTLKKAIKRARKKLK